MNESPTQTAAPEPARERAAEELAVLARDGCEKSLEALVKMFHQRVYHYLWQMTRNQHDAEDLTQTTFLKAFRAMGSFTQPHSFAPWLFTIAKRTALNHFRGTRQTEELNEEHRVDLSTPADRLVSKEQGGQLWEWAQQLPPAQHEVLWLRYGESFSISEIARIMKTNQIRVRVLLHRARERLGELVRRANAQESGPDNSL